jgi:uncharacterized lipoprotein YmbA
MTLRQLLSLSALAVLAPSCASTPTSYFYTLNALAAPGPKPSNVSIVVVCSSVPAEVDRPQWVLSTGANEVRIDDFNRWASPLQDAIARVTAENLATLLATPRVSAFPQMVAETDYRVTIEVQRFESRLGDSITFDAVWMLRRSKDGNAELRRTTVRESALRNSYSELAAAHSRALLRLSTDIAKEISASIGASAGSSNNWPRRSEAGLPMSDPHHTVFSTEAERDYI